MHILAPALQHLSGILILSLRLALAAATFYAKNLGRILEHARTHQTEVSCGPGFMHHHLGQLTACGLCLDCKVLANFSLCNEQHVVVVMAWACQQMEDMPQEQLCLTLLQLMASC